MSQVPQHLIDEAARRGIVPGAEIRDDNSRIGIVTNIEEWGLGEFGSIFLKSGSILRAFNANTDKWATVITPAPSQQPQAIGLQEGDAVECGPAMRAAIIELAKELGICEGENGGLHEKAYGVWNCHGSGRVNVISNFELTTKITPEAFIAKMRVTATQPKPIKIGGNTVKFSKGEIKVGCTMISNETVRAVAAKLID